MEPSRLLCQLTEHEPEEFRNYLMVPRTDQPYASGSGVPLLTAGVTTEQTGLSRVGHPPRSRPIDYTGVYLTFDDYVTGFTSAHADSLINYFVAQADTQTMLTWLAILNHGAHDQAAGSRIWEQFAEVLEPSVRERFTNLTSHAGEDRRHFLSRQPLLAAMREVLSRSHVAEQAADMPPALAAVFLSHTVAMQLNARRGDDERRLGGQPAGLAMEIVRNQAFHATEDRYALIDRHVRLWREFGQSVTDPSPRRPPLESLSEASGTDLMAILSGGFGLYAHVSNWELGNPFPRRKPIAQGFQEHEGAVLGLLARDVGSLQSAIGEAQSTWNLLPFQQSPVLDTGDALVVLDEDYLLGRVTTGLYWVVHDHEKHLGEKERHLWTQVYGDMVHKQMESSLDNLGLPLFNSGATIFSESDVGNAYTGRRADRVIDRGDSFIVAEVVSGRLSVASRVEGEVGSFEWDTEKLIMKKVRQIHDTGRAILADGGWRLTGVERGLAVRVVPLVVVAGGFGGYPLNPITIEYLAQLMTEEDLFADARFDPICIVDNGEVELLEGLTEGGRNPTSMLRQWRQSPLERMPFRNWAVSELRDGDQVRPARMEDHVSGVFEEIIETLGLGEPS